MNKIKIGRELRTLNNIIMRHAENTPPLKKVKQLTGTNGWVLAYLHHNRDRDVFQRDLEKDFGITRSTASRVISLLIQKGFIEHKPVASDGRLKKLVLTPKAMSLNLDMENDIKAFEEKLISGFSPNEIKRLFEYIQRMKNNIE